jgi:hypothetical protein
MNRIVTLITALVLLSISINAQNVVFEADTTYASGFYNDGADIPCTNHLINNGSMTYTIKWTKTEFLPTGWESSFCDKVNCWIPSVMTKTYPLNAGEQAIMKVLARTNNNPGIGMVKINVTSPDDDNLNLNAYYIVTAQEGTSISKVQSMKDVTIYPIPANEYITVLVNPNLRANRMEIYNVLGQRLKSELFTAEKNNRIDLNIQDLDKGMYFVRVYNSNNTVITRQFTKE